MRARIPCPVFVAGLLLAMTPAWIPELRAHEFSTSYSVIGVEGTNVEIRFIINGTELHNGPTLDTDGDDRVTEDEVLAGLESFAEAIVAHYDVSVPGSPPAEPELAGWRFVAGSVLELTFASVFDRAATDLHVVSRLDQVTQANHSHLVQVGTDAGARQAILTRDFPEITIDYATGIPLWVTAYEFLFLGVEHIAVGYDHLAFLAGVIMATTALGSLVKIVSAFTVGHSITLVLASFDVVHLPPRLVESVIALSIAYVAAENFLGRKLVDRWILTFLFGLVHGFGFSSVLRELGLAPGHMALSLFSFNLGVELGQLVFVLVLVPLLVAIGKSRWKEPVTATASVAVMTLGFYWFVQRAVFG